MSGICSDPDIQEGLSVYSEQGLSQGFWSRQVFSTCVYGRLREDFQGVCSDELDDIFILLVCFGFCISPVYSREIGVPFLNSFKRSNLA